MVISTEFRVRKKRVTKREKEESHAGQVKLRIWLLLSTQENSTGTSKTEEKGKNNNGLFSMNTGPAVH